jgi:hypothetical protein
MEILEIDERFPSFEVKVNIKISHFSGEFRYSANDIWFICSEWDDFTNNLASWSNQENTATLRSMSDEFTLLVSQNEIMISLKEKLINGPTVDLKYCQISSVDDVYILRESFAKFDKWW